MQVNSVKITHYQNIPQNALLPLLALERAVSFSGALRKGDWPERSKFLAKNYACTRKGNGERTLLHRFDAANDLTHFSRNRALAGFVVFAREEKFYFVCFV